jgi:addiction module HigA family antidote
MALEVIMTVGRQWITIKEMTMAVTQLIAGMHPGRTIAEDVLKPLGMSVNALCKELRVPATRLNDIVRGRRGVTADTALRLARYLGTTPPVLAESSIGL